MRLTIAAVGRLRAGPIKALYDEYARRLPWPVSVHEVAEAKAAHARERREREARALLKLVPERTLAVALDESGEPLSSRAFADRLARWRDDGRDLAFLIGGADGHGEAVLARADLVLSLGAMTWPHLLVRALLAEQLYRAHAILSHHPYHRS